MNLPALLAELYPTQPLSQAQVTVVVIDPQALARHCTRQDARFIRAALSRGARYRQGRGEG